MSTSLVVNGVSYPYPDTGDQSWGTVASAWAAAVTSGMLQKAGGSFILTADANFGSNFGLLAKYFTSVTASAAASGVLRLASADSIAWRNNAGGGDVLLAKNSSDQLTWNGTVIASSAGVVPVAAGGTGITSGTSGGILGFTGTGTIASSALLAASQLVIGGGAGATPTTLAAGSQYQVLTMGAANPGYGAVNLAQAAAVTGVLPNANTTAASANTASTIVARDGSGNFSAGTVSVSGLNVSGLTASQAVVTDSSKNLASLAYTNANTASTLVQRDGSGNFSAGTITATFTGNVTGNLTGSVTGTASGNTTYTANQYGVVLSGSGNTMSVLAPDSSTVKVLVSGGASANPSWGDGGVSTATASRLAFRDSNANIRFNGVIENFATTATAGTTTTLTVSSSRIQQFTGSTTQTVVLPDATTLVVGQSFVVFNRSSGVVTVNANGGSLVQSMSAGSQSTFTVTSIGTSTGVWDSAISFTSGSGSGSVTSVTFTGDGTVFSSTPSSAVTTSGTVTASLKTQTANTFLCGPLSGSAAAPTFKALTQPLVTKYTAAGTSTHVITGNPLYCRVRMVGAGGGGGGGGTAAGATGSAGTTTYFRIGASPNLLVANGGSGGSAWSGLVGGVGGTASLGAGPVGTALTGGTGGISSYTGFAGNFQSGGMGAPTPFGGGGIGGGGGANAGSAPPANTGAGGGGGGHASAANAAGGGGGGAGGFVDAIIFGPGGVTFALQVGAGGAGGTAGTNGAAGGAGADGYIEVTEFYQ